MSKITSEHLTRTAVVYVRQSTAFQVTFNRESQRRQYALSDRAGQLGWSDVEVIDDDLGRSGAGARRPGFERLLAAICEGRVGAVLSLEASSRDALLVKSTVDLAHSLGLRVVAEGVETPLALALLRTMGCDAVQGYLIGKPMILAELSSHLTPRTDDAKVAAA